MQPPLCRSNTMHGNIHLDEFGMWMQLLRDLRGSTPVFMRERWLREGGVCWMPEYLPKVLVAPDVFAYLQKKPGAVMEFDGATPRLTLPLDYEEAPSAEGAHD